MLLLSPSASFRNQLSVAVSRTNCLLDYALLLTVEILLANDISCRQLARIVVIH